jgi:hypothetical protein
VFGHDHISENHKPIAPVYALQNPKENITPSGAVEERLPLVAAESEEVQIPSAIHAVQILRHERRLKESLGGCL